MNEHKQAHGYVKSKPMFRLHQPWIRYGTLRMIPHFWQESPPPRKHHSARAKKKTLGQESPRSGNNPPVLAIINLPFATCHLPPTTCHLPHALAANTCENSGRAHRLLRRPKVHPMHIQCTSNVYPVLRPSKKHTL